MAKVTLKTNDAVTKRSEVRCAWEAEERREFACSSLEQLRRICLRICPCLSRRSDAGQGYLMSFGYS